jgi:hypothetical protein
MSVSICVNNEHGKWQSTLLHLIDTAAAICLTLLLQFDFHCCRNMIELLL